MQSGRRMPLLDAAAAIHEPIPEVTELVTGHSEVKLFENHMIAEDQKPSARESKNPLLANSYLAGFSERPRLADHRSAEQIFLNLSFRAQCQLTTRH